MNSMFFSVTPWFNDFLNNIMISILFIFLLANFSLAADKIPERIISLAPSITEELYLLGVGHKIVGVSTYCRKPEDAKNKERVGMVTKASIEKIVSLNPDLVLVTDLTDSYQIEKLKSMDIKVLFFTMYKNKNFSQICEQFIELGKTVDKEKLAKKIVQRAEKKAAAIQKKVENLPKPKVAIQLGTKPLWLATKDSFINDFIELAGGVNIGPAGQSGLYSRENLLKQNPDVIIIVTMGITGIEEKKIWQKYKTLNAAKNNRIHIVDSDAICSPTPESFVEVLGEISEIIHPGEAGKDRKGAE